MKFLENPGKRRRARKSRKGGKKRRGRFVKGSAAAKRYMASIRPGAKRKRKRATTTKKRRRSRRTTTTGGVQMARKRTTRRRRRAAAPKRTRRRRRSYRNPPTLALVKRGLMDGAAITAGKAATRLVAGRLPMLPKKGAAALAAQLAVAAGVSFVAGKFAPVRHRAMMQAGAFASVLEDAIVAAKVPLLSPALDAYPLAAYASPFAALPSGDEGNLLATDLPAFGDVPNDAYSQSQMWQ